jgi:hypothetical protein
MLHKTKFGLDVSIEIVRDSETDSAHVHVHAPIYKNKHWVMAHSYRASEFTDFQIINDADFVSVMCKHYQ